MTPGLKRRESRATCGFEGRIDVPNAMKCAHNLDAFGARPIEDHVLANDKASRYDDRPIGTMPIF